MATFKYIKGNTNDGTGKIDNAIGYRLLYKNSSTNGQYWAGVVKNKIQAFPISGAIGENGMPAEELKTVYLTDVPLQTGLRPITRLTKDGWGYYIRLTGNMTVVAKNRTYTGVPFGSVVTVTDSNEIKNFSFETTMKIKGDGIYLVTSLGDVKVYDVDTEDVTSAESNFYVEVGHNPEGFERTEYIPIDVLTNDDDGVCVGGFSDTLITSGMLAYKIAFYDENLSFIVGATIDDIHKEFGINKTHLQVADIRQLFSTKVSVTDQTKLKYVVFSSKYIPETDGTGNYVSIGYPYFPFFQVPSYLSKTEDNYIKVQAVGDGVFFTDSEIPDDTKAVRVTFS